MKQDNAISSRPGPRGLLAAPERLAELTSSLPGLPSWTLTPRQFCDLEMLMSGAFAPLDGFLELRGEWLAERGRIAAWREHAAAHPTWESTLADAPPLEPPGRAPGRLTHRAARGCAEPRRTVRRLGCPSAAYYAVFLSGGRAIRYSLSLCQMSRRISDAAGLSLADA